MPEQGRQQRQNCLKPGVVWGDDYRTLVSACKQHGYALPAINVVSTNGINAVLEAASRKRSDVIVQLSGGGARFFAGDKCPNPEMARVLGAVSAARHVHLLAEHYGVCVALHTDHADRALIPWVDALVEFSRDEYKRVGRPLFSSHMLDLSTEPLDENLAECSRMLKQIAPLGMSLEIELGVTGGEEDGIGTDYMDAVDNSHLYTQPEDVLRAYEVLSPLGHFSVAASFGNVHGVYAPGNVRLRPEILRESQKLVTAKHKTQFNPLHLVFHGGSGSEKEKIAQGIQYGIFKMNIDTDTQFAFSNAAAAYILKNKAAFVAQIDSVTGKPNKKTYDPRTWLRAGEAAMAERVELAFDDLRSSGRSLAK